MMLRDSFPRLTGCWMLTILCLLCYARLSLITWKGWVAIPGGLSQQRREGEALEKTGGMREERGICCMEFGDWGEESKLPNSWRWSEWRSWRGNLTSPAHYLLTLRSPVNTTMSSQNLQPHLYILSSQTNSNQYGSRRPVPCSFSILLISFLFCRQHVN